MFHWGKKKKQKNSHKLNRPTKNKNGVICLLLVHCNNATAAMIVMQRMCCVEILPLYCVEVFPMCCVGISRVLY